MLIVPGLAVPTGSNIYTLVVNDLPKYRQLLQNFYQLNSADFFVILILQQTMFDIFGSLNCLGAVMGFGMSPSVFLLYKRLPHREQMLLKTESNTHDYGHNAAVDLTVLGIIFIYS